MLSPFFSPSRTLKKYLRRRNPMKEPSVHKSMRFLLSQRKMPSGEVVIKNKPCKRAVSWWQLESEDSYGLSQKRLDRLHYNVGSQFPSIWTTARDDRCWKMGCSYSLKTTRFECCSTQSQENRAELNFLQEHSCCLIGKVLYILFQNPVLRTTTVGCF